MAASVLKPNLGARSLRCAAGVIGIAFLSMAGPAGVGAQTQPAAKDLTGAAASSPQFEVASIHLIADAEKAGYFSMSPPGSGEFVMHNVSLAVAIGWAFEINADNLAGGPKWLDSTTYDIAAKPPDNAGLTYDQLRPMVQQLLEERFHLACHRETRERKGYALTVAQGGPKLTASKDGGQYAYVMLGRLDAQNVSAGVIAGLLSSPLGQPVADKTGLKGKYDFHIQFAPLDAADSTQPSIFTAVEEQVGLRLEKATVPVELLVIDHVDRVPTPN